MNAMATEWVSRYARHEVGLEAGVTGHATVACREHKTSHEIDILSLERGTRRHTRGSGVAFIGEAKSGGYTPGIADLERLEHIRVLLTNSGHDATAAVLGLFSTNGFSAQVEEEAARHEGRVLLTGLDRLYGTRSDL